MLVQLAGQPMHHRGEPAVRDGAGSVTAPQRDCLRVLQLSEQVAAACLLAAVQGVELRRAITTQAAPLAPGLQAHCAAVRRISAPLIEDRPLEAELRQLVTAIQQQVWPLYTESKHG